MRGRARTLADIQNELDEKQGKGEFLVLEYTSTDKLAKFRHKCGALHEVLLYNILKHPRRCKECGKGCSKSKRIDELVAKEKVAIDPLCTTNDISSIEKGVPEATNPATTTEVDAIRDSIKNTIPNIDSPEWFSYLQDSIDKLYGKGEFFVVSFILLNPSWAYGSATTNYSITLCHKCGNVFTSPYQGADIKHYKCTSCNTVDTAIQNKLDKIYSKGVYTVLAYIRGKKNILPKCIVKHTCGNTLIATPTDLINRKVGCDNCTSEVNIKTPSNETVTEFDIPEVVPIKTVPDTNNKKDTAEAPTEIVAEPEITEPNIKVASVDTSKRVNTPEITTEVASTVKRKGPRTLSKAKVQLILDKIHGENEFKVIEYYPNSADQKYPFVEIEHKCGRVKRDYYSSVKKPNYKCACSKKPKKVVQVEEEKCIIQKGKEPKERKSTKPISAEDRKRFRELLGCDGLQYLTEKKIPKNKVTELPKDNKPDKETKSDKDTKMINATRGEKTEILWGMQEAVDAEFGVGKYKVSDHERFGGQDIFTFKHTKCGEEIRTTLSTMQAKSGRCRGCGK